MAEDSLQNLIVNLVHFPNLSSTNFRLGLAYHKLGQTAAAATFFLKAAEIQIEQDTCHPFTIAYTAMILAGECFEKQGRRDVSAKSCYLHAVNICPDRPEAYFYLSRLYQRIGKNPDAYTYATIGLTKDPKPYPCLPKTAMAYPGVYGLYYQKAVAAWWWGRTKESIDMFHMILRDYEAILPEEYKKSIIENLEKIDPNFKKKSILKDTGKVAIVVQGPYHDYTSKIIEKYLSYPFVSEVIFSTWTSPVDISSFFPKDPKFKFITSPQPVEGPGIDNRNRMIVSSLAGIEATQCPIVFKIRSDQLFSENTLSEYLVHFSKNKAPNKIFSFGEFPDLLYHPCDHMFLGKNEDMKLLFSAPQEKAWVLEGTVKNIMKAELYRYYHTFIRSETYLGMHYCANFEPKLYKYLTMPDRYLYDGAFDWWPVKAESIDIYPKYFETLPEPVEPVLWHRPGRDEPINYPMIIEGMRWKRT
jgi:tetratricopeptide (TPR) repeat protein